MNYRMPLVSFLSFRFSQMFPQACFDFFQRLTTRFNKVLVREPDTDETDDPIGNKGIRQAHGTKHGWEGQRDQHVGNPVGSRCQRSPQPTNIQWEDFTDQNLGDWSPSTCVKGNVNGQADGTDISSRLAASIEVQDPCHDKQ